VPSAPPRGRRPSRAAFARRRAVAIVLVLAVVAGAVLTVRALVATGPRPHTASPSTPAGAAARKGRAGAAAADDRVRGGGRNAAERLVAALAPWRLPAPVSRAVVLRSGDRITVLGGLATGDVSTAAIWSLDPLSGRARRAGELSAAVHDAAGAELDGRAFVFGGGSLSTVGTVQAFSAGRATVVGSLPVARSDLAAAVVGRRAYVLGGFDGTSLVRDILETTDGTHFRLAGELAQPVRYPAVAAAGGAIWVVGGQLGTSESTSTGGQTTDIQRFDPATGRTAVVGHLPAGLGHASAFVLDGQLFVAGGRSGTALSARIWRIDTASGSASRAGTLPYRRSDAGVAVVGNRAWLLGGESSGPLAPLDSVVELRLEPSPAAGVAAAVRPAARGATPNVYAADGPNMLSPVVRHMPYLIYVPESAGSDVDVIDPKTYKVIARYQTGLDPQHVVPAWNLKTLYATNDLGNSLTPISPYTGRPEGPNIPVTDPYNMYFTPDGRYAIVVEEADQVLAFRNPRTFALVKALHVDCPGVDHGDFSADGTFAVFSCEFSARMVKVDLATKSVAGYLNIPGSAPQDVKLDPSGAIFYTADMNRGGVYEIDAATFKVIGFIPTGRDAHGLYVSRDDRYLYVTDRGAGAVSVIDFATRKVTATWHIPGGGSPDMGNVSPDGKVLWVSGRYNDCVYAISTTNGHLLAEIPVPNEPHGLAVWPQPGNYSLGHTGIMR
jgi:YVTN family beta-propeller protein